MSEVDGAPHTPTPRSNGAGPSDADAVRRVLDGDREAYGILIRRHQERLHRFALGMVRDPDAATDLVQESLVTAYTKLESCRDPTSFGAWVRQILRNRCRDFLKNVRRDNEPLDAHPTLVSRLDGPDSELARNQLRGRLRDALDELPADQREAFLLKHLDGRTYREMSGILDASKSALKMRVHRAREALRAALDEEAAAAM